MVTFASFSAACLDLGQLVRETLRPSSPKRDLHLANNVEQRNREYAWGGVSGSSDDEPSQAQLTQEWMSCQRVTASVVCTPGGLLRGNHSESLVRPVEAQACAKGGPFSLASAKQEPQESQAETLLHWVVADLH